MDNEEKKAPAAKPAKKPASKKAAPKKSSNIADSITDLVRTSVFAGLGLAFMGEEKIEQWVKDVAKKNNLSTKDMQSFMSDLRKEGKKARADLEKKVKTLIKDIVPPELQKKLSGK